MCPICFSGNEQDSEASSKEKYRLREYTVIKERKYRNMRPKVKVTELCPTLHCVVSDSLQPCRLYSLWNTGVGSLSLLQGFFPTQGLNPGLPHCR